jgi:hypothetical protein
MSRLRRLVRPFCGGACIMVGVLGSRAVDALPGEQFLLAVNTGLVLGYGIGTVVGEILDRALGD